MKVGVTGHRPERIAEPDMIKAKLSESLNYLKPDLLYQGMAAGVDLWSAKEAWKLGIPYICVRPWAGHKPRIQDTVEYAKVIKHSAGVFDVSAFQEYTGPWLYAKRNEWIVHASDVMIAVWDGQPNGGTYNCVKYAWSCAIPVWRIDPETGGTGYASEEVPF